MLRLGLVAKFAHRAIHFRSTTATSLLKMDREAALDKLSRLILQNAAALQQALTYCTANGIGAFRIGSGILPLKTHPEAGYEVTQLPQAEEIVARFKACGYFAQEHDLRLSFHPSQFTLLSSADAGVTERSLAEIEYQAEVAQWVGADVINIHGGGAYGDKAAALGRVATHLGYLSAGARRRLTMENDDRVYTPADLLPLCRRENVPFVYDVHHHRVLPDGQSVPDVTRQALATWDREPLFHVSSPRDGWGGAAPQRHHDYVNPADFPACWLEVAQARDLTVDVEAKGKELAVLGLLFALQGRGVALFAV